MKQKLTLLGLFILLFFAFSCGSKAESAESIAKKWCELNTKVRNAPSDSEEKEKAKEERKKYEDEMDAKYKDNKEMYDKIREETRKCDE